MPKPTMGATRCNEIEQIDETIVSTKSLVPRAEIPKIHAQATGAHCLNHLTISSNVQKTRVSICE